MKKEIYISDLGEVIANAPFLEYGAKTLKKGIKEAVKDFYRNFDTCTPDEGLLPVIDSLLKVSSIGTTIGYLGQIYGASKGEFPTHFGDIYRAVKNHFPVGSERDYYSSRLGLFIIQTILYIELQYEVKAKAPYHQASNHNYSNDDSTPKDLQASIAELQNLFGAIPKQKKRK